MATQQSAARPAQIVSADGERLAAEFLAGDPPTAAGYTALFRYFLHGFAANRLPHLAGVRHEGLRSYNGQRSDDIEGFTRAAPLLAAWLAAGRPAVVALADQRPFDLAAALRDGVRAGTEPGHPGYWGRIRSYNQRIVEAADIALALWLARRQVWEPLAPAERARIVAWLRPAVEAWVYDNGWQLFSPLIALVLERLGYPLPSGRPRRNYERVKTFYRGEGWFSDGPRGPFDYYNAWHYHYVLFWLGELDPHWDPAFIATAQRAFLDNYRFLLGPAGVPMLGRSICYRLATPAPLVIGAMRHPDVVAPAEARRALDGVWGYFARHGGLRRGNVAQGYHGDDPRVVDNYSGPASALWSLRSLVVAFYQPEDAPLWQTAPGKLPVEEGDYERAVPSIGWVIRGRQAGHVIEVENLRVPATADPPLRPITAWRRLAERLLHLPFRPANRPAKYGRRFYSSARPLGE